MSIEVTGNDERLFRANLERARADAKIHAFRISREHFLWLAEQIERHQPGEGRDVAYDLARDNGHLRKALHALYIQALQSNVNAAANEWGQEALALARAVLGLSPEKIKD